MNKICKAKKNMNKLKPQINNTVISRIESVLSFNEKVFDTVSKCQTWIRRIEDKFNICFSLNREDTIFGDYIADLRCELMHVCPAEIGDDHFISIMCKSDYDEVLKSVLIPTYLIDTNEDELKSYVLDYVNMMVKDIIESTTYKIKEGQSEFTNLMSLKNTKINFDDL